MSEELKRDVALITGASSGIGLAFAEEYAKRRADLILVARREAVLEEIAVCLRSEYGIKVTVLPCDLSDPLAPNQLFDKILAQRTEVTILVNNAGYGVPGSLCESDWLRHRDTIQVMAAAPVHLCHLFAPSMQKNGRGHIINVSSLAALLPPHAGGTLYYPVKSFLCQFSIAFRAEMRPSQVNVTAICPGFTNTAFQDAAGGTVEKVSLPKWMWADPGYVARSGINAVEMNKAVCVPGLINKLIAVFFKILPGSVGRLLSGA